MNIRGFKTFIVQAIVLYLFIINQVFAVSIIGTINQSLKLLPNQPSINDGSPSPTYKIIQLLKIKMSEEEKKRLAKRADDALKHINQFAIPTNSNNLDLSKKVQLGMNKVPVLDQGRHGTCVTFAVTGALDALIQKEDYISQLCNLQLGNYLEIHGYGSSGWNGSWSSHVINQIEQFGVMNKEKEHHFGCGGLKTYPAHTSRTPKTFIEPEKYHPLSELIFGKLATWSQIYQSPDTTRTLNEMKEALKSGDRLIFAVMLPRTDLGTMGAVGRHKTWIFKDTWLLTPDILKGVDKIDSSHVMIITGYDDNAVAVDNKGKKHKGLLTLRNSWGRWAGNYGEFYMSYDYFNLLSYDLIRLSRYSA